MSRPSGVGLFSAIVYAFVMAPIAVGVGRLSTRPAMRLAVLVGIAAATVQAIPSSVSTLPGQLTEVTEDLARRGVHHLVRPPVAGAQFPARPAPDANAAPYFDDLEIEEVVS